MPLKMTEILQCHEPFNKLDPSQDDKILQCRDCERDFCFPAKDQVFYAAKGFNKPIRCKPCRTFKKQKCYACNCSSGYGGDNLETKEHTSMQAMKNILMDSSGVLPNWK